MSGLLLCRINRVHSAVKGSLSTSLQLVTWILAGVIVPVETDAGIVRGSQLLDEDAACECTAKIGRSRMARAARRESCGAKMADEVTLQRVVVEYFSHLDTSAGELDYAG